MRAAGLWLALVVAIGIPLAIAATSPLLQWRQPVYIIGGFAGTVALCLLLVQPLLAGGDLPGPKGWRPPRLHRWVGAALVLAVVVHVAALWITSPPDVIDVLLFRSPTPFAIWGVIAMWAVFASALVAALRKRIGLRGWRVIHTVLAVVIVITTVLHAVLIEGTMGQISKIALCILAAGATAKVIRDRRVWAIARRRGGA